MVRRKETISDDRSSKNGKGKSPQAYDIHSSDSEISQTDRSNIPGKRGKVDYESVETLYREGKTISQIANTLECTYQEVDAYFKMMNYTNNPGIIIKKESGPPSMANLIKDVANDVLKPKEGEESKFLKVVNKYEKYLPIVGNFVQGFLENMQKQQAMKPKVTVQGPSGWDSLSPLQRMSRKYEPDGSMSDWYRAGEAWEEYKKTGNYNIRENQSQSDYTDKSGNQYTYMNEQDPEKRRQKFQEERAALMGGGNSKPSSMAELAHKYPEAPLVSNDKPNQDAENSNVSGENDKPLQHPDSNSQSLNTTEAQKAKEYDNVIHALHADANKYITIGADYINAMSMEDFQKYVKNIQPLLNKLKFVKIFIPIHLRDVIVLTPSEHFVQLIKERCVDKYKWLEETDGIQFAKGVFDEVKKIMQ